MCDCVALITEQAGNCYSESVVEDFARESRVETLHLKKIININFVIMIKRKQRSLIVSEREY